MYPYHAQSVKETRYNRRVWTAGAILLVAFIELTEVRLS